MRRFCWSNTPATRCAAVTARGKAWSGHFQGPRYMARAVDAEIPRTMAPKEHWRQPCAPVAMRKATTMVLKQATKLDVVVVRCPRIPRILGDARGQGTPSCTRIEQEKVALAILERAAEDFVCGHGRLVVARQ